MLGKYLKVLLVLTIYCTSRVSKHRCVRGYRTLSYKRVSLNFDFLLFDILNAVHQTCSPSSPLLLPSNPLVASKALLHLFGELVSHCPLVDFLRRRYESLKR